MQLVSQDPMQLNAYIRSFACRTLSSLAKGDFRFKIIGLFCQDPLFDAVFAETVLTLGALFWFNHNALTNFAYKVRIKRLFSRDQFRVNHRFRLVYHILTVFLNDEVDIRFRQL